MALITKELVKTFTGMSQTDTSKDALLTQIANYIDADIKEYCGWDIEKTTYPGASVNGRGDSGNYRGTGVNTICLVNTPVWSITSIYEDITGRYGQNPDGSFDSTTLLVSGTDYVLHYDGCVPGTSIPCSYSGVVERIPGVWPDAFRRRMGNIIPQYQQGIGNIKVAYVAGYPTTPPAVEAAANLMVALMRRMTKFGSGFLQAETLGMYSYSLAQTQAGNWPELASARQLLARFRRQSI